MFIDLTTFTNDSLIIKALFIHLIKFVFPGKNICDENKVIPGKNSAWLLVIVQNVSQEWNKFDAIVLNRKANEIINTYTMMATHLKCNAIKGICCQLYSQAWSDTISIDLNQKSFSSLLWNFVQFVLIAEMKHENNYSANVLDFLCYFMDPVATAEGFNVTETRWPHRSFHESGLLLF